jgi:translation initiation factor 3 subunit L
MSSAGGISKVPQPVSNWIFDIHDATRRSLLSEDVSHLYDVERKNVNDKYFAHSPWPSSSMVASDCSNDATFLLFYEEIRCRHLFTKLKPQLNDFISSWKVYTELFDYVTNGSKEDDLLLTPQWIHDITAEFIYQFQGFCQYRCQSGNKTDEDIMLLKEHESMWSLTAVLRILRSLIDGFSNKIELILSKTTDDNDIHNKSIIFDFGYFAIIEKARLECLLGDYCESITTIRSTNLNDQKTYLQIVIPSCRINALYHLGISHLMSRNYIDALEIFENIYMYMIRCSKLGTSTLTVGTAKSGLDQLIKKMSDKILALICICIALCPSKNIDEQIRENIGMKWGEKLRRLYLGEISSFSDLFEIACPRFISAHTPDYDEDTKSSTVAAYYEAHNNRINVFLGEIQQHLDCLKLRSYLKLYASIDMERLASFNNISVVDLYEQLMCLRKKTEHSTLLTTNDGDNIVSVQSDKTVATTDIEFYIHQNVLVIDSLPSDISRKSQMKDFFVKGLHRNVESVKDVTSFNNILI